MAGSRAMPYGPARLVVVSLNPAVTVLAQTGQDRLSPREPSRFSDENCARETMQPSPAPSCPYSIGPTRSTPATPTCR